MSATNIDFEASVLAKSREVPVVVDFWAPWCGPCQTLGPVIEKLAEEAAGKWVLVKLNVDERPELSQQYKVRGIPAVKMFVDGEVTAEFSGALPEMQIRQWLDEHLPSPQKQLLNEAQTLFAQGQFLEAQALLERILTENPNEAAASLLMAKILAFNDPERAESTLQTAIAQPKTAEEALHTKELIKLLQLAHHPDLPEDEKMQPKMLQALEHLQHQDFDAALSLFVEGVMLNKQYAEELPRKACISIFQFLGEQHPVTKKYRRRFNMALY